MNSVVLTGRLIKDLELKFTQNGQALTSGVIAVDRKFKKDGQKVADFFNISLFGKLAEITVQFCGKKGDMLNVRGSLQTSTYNKRDGSKGYTVSVLVEECDFLTSNNRQREENTPEAVATPPQKEENPVVPKKEVPIVDDDEFDPFNLDMYKKQAEEKGSDLANFLKNLAEESGGSVK